MKTFPQYNRDMLIKYDKLLPRYTSYPTALQFTEGFTQQDWLTAWNSVEESSELSLYFHIPFCRSPCFYCACNRIITRDATRSTPYLDAIFKEMALVSSLLSDKQKKVSQVHLGGGTPTFLSPEQLSMLWEKIHQYFRLEFQGEYSIEIDPRAASIEMIQHLAELGFNRMSFGVQDLNKDVQEAINRIQSVKETFAQIDAARKAGVQSINVDLIYGLPKQTEDTFANTIDRVIDARPERVAVYGYAHMPAVFKAQRQIAKFDLPDLSSKLMLLELAIEKFQSAGYEYIGLDHFALPHDELSIARNNGSLQRNFQGYSTRKNLNMLGFGVTSIGKVGNAIFQNHKLEDEYIRMLSNGTLPLIKGYVMTQDDQIRKAVIMSLMCQGVIIFESLFQKYGAVFNEYFHLSMPELLQFQRDGLIDMNDEKLTITPVGQLLLRNIANVFDAYRSPQSSAGMSIKVAM